MGAQKIVPSVKSDRELLREMEAHLPQRALEEMQLTEPCYSVKDAAKKLGISESMVREYLNDEALGFERFFMGRTRMIWRADIITIWVLRHSVYRPEIHKFDEDKRIPPPCMDQQLQEDGPRLRIKRVS